MKLFFLLIISLLSCTLLRAQKVGIGTTNPQSLLDVFTDGSFSNSFRISNNSAATVGPTLYFNSASKAYTITATNAGSATGRNKLIIRDYSEGENRLVVDTTGNIGIATDNPTALLDVNGIVRIRGGSPAPGKVLTSNAAGTASWANPSSPAATASFKAAKDDVQSFTSGINAQVFFFSNIYNDGGGYFINNFTAPAAGVYHFEVKLMWELTSALSQFYIITGLLSGGGELSRSQAIVPAGISGNMTSDLSADVKLTAGQVVYATGYQNSGSNQSVMPFFSHFSGHRVF